VGPRSLLPIWSCVTSSTTMWDAIGLVPYLELVALGSIYSWILELLGILEKQERCFFEGSLGF
jgi:hypothetical protein